MRLAWGLSDLVPPDAVGAWGARADIVDDEIDIPVDRQDWQGSADILQALVDVFSIAALKQAVSALLRSGRMSRHRAETFVLYENSITVVADTLASGDYCYLSAWLRKA